MNKPVACIFENFMPEAEVSIRTAVHLLKLPDFRDLAEVQVQKNQLTRKDATNNKVSFAIGTLITELGLQPTVPKCCRDDFYWFGQYSMGEKKLVIHNKRGGLGDVVANIGSKRLRIQCKGGFLEPNSSNSKSNGKEYAALWSVLGQVVATETVNDNDILAIAVPLSSAYKQLISKFQNRPLIKQLGIKFIFVNRSGKIEGLEDIQ